MHVFRADDGFRFLCSMVHGPFAIQMTLADDGSEGLQTAAREIDLNLPTMPLISGSIARLLGPERWGTFLRLRDNGHEQMLL